MLYYGSTSLEDENYGMTTLNFVNHGLAWQFKKCLNYFFLFQGVPFFFKKFVKNGVSFTNRHLLVLDGHGSHVTLKVVSQAQEMGLDMITLPSHTSRDLEPLDVSCFKPFKTTFRKVRDVAMFRNNHMELYKITLDGWVNKVMEQSLTKKISSLDSWP